MGLLDKALQGTVQPKTPSQADGGGFLAKAQAARAPRETPPEATHDAATCIHESLVLEEAEEPRLSVADLANLESELLNLPPKIDFLLAAFSRLSEALPFKALALFLPRRDELCLAASIGFSSPGRSTLPSALAESLGSPGSVFADAGRADLTRALGEGPPDAKSLRGAALISASDSSLFGLWVYTYPESSLGLSEEAASIGEILSGCSNRGAPSFSMTEQTEETIAHVFRAIPPDHCAAAMLFDLEPIIARALSAMPGLLREAVIAATVSAAAGLVGSHGKALLLADAKLALILYSSSPLDAELALFQFRKSLGRSLVILEGFDAPAGESFSFDPSEGGTLEALGRFLAG